MNGIIENFLIVGAQATILIVVAIIFRRILKKSSKVFVYGMWLLILLRLCIPITTDSRLGLIDRQKEVPVAESADMGVNENAYWQDRYEGINWDNLTAGTAQKEPVSLNAQLEALEQSEQKEPVKEVKPVIELTKEDVVIAVWILGMVVLITASVVQLVRLTRKTAFAINTEDNVWETDSISTAFVMGFARTRIYLPTGLSIKEREYILSHEKTHIKHKDHIVRILMLLVNIVYWWNPFVWLAIWLMKKDMEMLCDEAVVRGLEHAEVKEYLNVLLSNSARNSGIIPVMSFGENNTEMRIKHIVNLKKSGAYALVVIISFGLISLVGCTTIAKHQPVQEDTKETTTENSTTEATTEDEPTTEAITEDITEEETITEATTEEAVTEEPSTKEPTTEIQVSVDELNLMQLAVMGKTDVYDTADGKMKKVMELPNYYENASFRYCDLDGDGVKEVVLDFIELSILHEKDGVIYRYGDTHRLMAPLYEDGTMNGSSGASYNQLIRIKEFTETEKIEEVIYSAIDGKFYKEYEYEGEQIELTEEELAAIREQYKEVPLYGHQLTLDNVVTILADR